MSMDISISGRDIVTSDILANKVLLYVCTNKIVLSGVSYLCSFKEEANSIMIFHALNAVKHTRKHMFSCVSCSLFSTDLLEMSHIV